ncbi:MAG TPA: hypothetical protein VMU54_03015 [Planctomycetota bacterium]|nr:hypothetical protein [Planctomycetota bacterium]
MIVGLLAMGVANAAALLGAGAILRQIRTGRTPVDLVLFLTVRLGILSTAVLAAGLGSFLTPLGLGGAGLAALIVLVVRGAHRGWRVPAELPWGQIWSIVAVLLVLRLLVQTWIFAPYVVDALSYHLPKIAEWVRAGAFTRELGVDPRSSFPAGFELVETWWVVFLHHDVLIELGGVEFLLLAGASVYALACELGWSVRAGRMAALLFTLSPGMYFQSISCVNDGAVAALVTATTLFLVARMPLGLTLLPVALGLGVKPTFLFALPGLGVLALLLRTPREPRPAAPRMVPVLTIVAFLVGGSWYLRNAVLFHNPLYPMGLGGMKSPVSGATLQRFGPSLQAFLENLRSFLDIRIYDRQMPPDALGTGNFNWGAAAFALGMPALAIVLRTEAVLRRIAIGFTVSLGVVFALVELDLWFPRFVLFFIALPSLALARLAERHRYAAVLGSLALALQVFATFVPGMMPEGAPAALARQGWRDRAALPLGGEGPVAFCCDDFGISYPLYGPAYARPVIYVRDRSTDELLEHLDREGVKTVVVFGPMRNQGAALEEARRRGRLRPWRRNSWSGYEVLPRT